MPTKHPSQCFVDETIHEEAGFVVTAFVFTAGRVAAPIRSVLRGSGLKAGEEFKSSSRMSGNRRMQDARAGLLSFAGRHTKIGLFVGPLERNKLGHRSLQALQSILVRNGIRPSWLDVYFDREMFRSRRDAQRLQKLFSFLQATRIHPAEDSRDRIGIQVADAVAGSAGRVIKEALIGTVKMIDIGGPDTGWEQGTMAPLGWSLLMSLRHAMLTRPVFARASRYLAATDPVILDPAHDDPVEFALHPTLLGWGVQIAPDSSDELRRAVEGSLGKIWLGCIH